MHEAQHQQRFINLLEHFSEQLDMLLLEVRRYEPQAIPVELLDEIAITTGELMLVLRENLSTRQAQGLATKAVNDAQRLRTDVRSRELTGEAIAAAVGALSEDVTRIIREDKRAA